MLLRILALILLATTARAATVTLDCPQHARGTFEADLIITTADPLGAYSVTLGFDATATPLLAVEGGDTPAFIPRPVINVLAGGSVLRLAGFQTSALDGPTGAVSVARLVFGVRRAGKRRIGLRVTSVLSTDAVPLPWTITGDCTVRARP